MKNSSELPKSQVVENEWKIGESKKNIWLKLIEAFKNVKEKREIKSKMKDLSKKISSSEELNNSDKEFILSLSTEDLDKFLWLLLKKLMEFVDWIHESDYREKDELDEWDVKGFLAINKVFDFIKEHRKDVKIKRYYFWPKFHIGKYRIESQPAWIYYDK